MAVRSVCPTVLLLLALLLCGISTRAGVVGTKHDFWVPGGGPPSSGQGGETCVFCHTPHTDNPSRPLWNREFSDLVFTPYSSSSMQATPGQPTGNSKLCLSCHDGTIAVREVLSSPGPVGLFGNVRGRASLGTDLSDDHPVSFVYDSALATQDGELIHPEMLTGVVQLDHLSEMQCTSCHDAHTDRWGDFLLMDSQFSALCITCHQKRGWSESSHNTSPATYLGGGEDPWPDTEWTTVAANGCSNCHTSHRAGYPETLLRFPFEEDNCLVCHDGSVAEKDIAADIRKTFRHPVDTSIRSHDPEEQIENMPRHVECHDCHNPHATAAWTALAPAVSGPLNRAPGISITGAPVESARFEYEVCLRCHGDSPGQPSPLIERQHPEPNIRLKIDPGNPSYHPIVDVGRNPQVPSLLSPWIPISLVYCSDCHASDSSSAQGGAAGPHGSIWPFLLEREYAFEDGTPESENQYDLCYKCHDRNSILGDRSFPEHRLHIVDEMSPCATCHDPHGISRAQATEVSASHLINFNVSVVTPDPSGLLSFEDLGELHGRCNLTCHGTVHEPAEY
jgi:predicted CXXCH cytochrome family protein